MKYHANTKQIFSFLLVTAIVSCNGQTGKSNATVAPAAGTAIVGGGCDGCEIMYVDMPAVMDAVDTSAGWNEKGRHLLVTGTVFKRDEKTAAPGVIIYYWQTDSDGLYSPKEGMSEKAKRHGHIRGWVKTGAAGNYSIYTIRPAPYPGGDIPAHIHTSVKEPGISNEYYIDEFVFDDDPLLTDQKRKTHENRGGSGILKTEKQNDCLVAKHDIILGLNIPAYSNDKQ